MSEPLPPLPGSVRDLIQAEDATPPGGDRSRIRARVLASVSLVTAATAATASTATAAGAGTTGTGTAAATGAAATITGKLVGLALVIAAAGGGAALVVTGEAPAAPISNTAAPQIDAVPSRVTVSPAPAIEHDPPPAPRSHAPTAAPPAATPRPRRPGPPRPRPTPLAIDPAPAPAPAADHRTTLTRAWTALAAGELATALALVDQDARRHPTGPLAEEREALRIVALARLGRTPEARERARAFAAHHPDSLHRALVERALRENP